MKWLDLQTSVNLIREHLRVELTCTDFVISMKRPDVLHTTDYAKYWTVTYTTSVLVGNNLITKFDYNFYYLIYKKKLGKTVIQSTFVWKRISHFYQQVCY